MVPFLFSVVAQMAESPLVWEGGGVRFTATEPLFRNFMGKATGVVLWIIGIFIAKGFWSTFFAVVMPLWSFYLVAESLYLKFFA